MTSVPSSPAARGIGPPGVAVQAAVEATAALAARVRRRRRERGKGERSGQ
jgi:hypothetical protein